MRQRTGAPLEDKHSANYAARLRCISSMALEFDSTESHAQTVSQCVSEPGACAPLGFKHFGHVSDGTNANRSVSKSSEFPD